MPKRLLRKTARGLAKTIDRAFSLSALNPPRVMRRRSSAESLDHAARMRGLGAIAGFYNRQEFILRPDDFFGRATSIEPQCKRARSFGKDGEVIDLSWPSEFMPLWSSPALIARFGELPADKRLELGFADDQAVAAAMHQLGVDRSGELRDKYFRSRANRTAHARWFRHHSGPRPCAVLIHGYMGGTYMLEERMWPVQKLFDSGLDVVLTVLPFHGRRRSEARRLLPPMFPSNDPRFTIEAFRQVVIDHRALFDYLLAGRVSDLGVMGQSLGGYSAALLATLEERLRFAVLFIPLASIDEFAHTHGRLVGATHEQEAQRNALQSAHWPVSPLARPSAISGDKVIVIAGESDVVTGISHAQKLAAHFGTQLTTFPGGHLLHLGRAQAFQPVWEMLERSGLIDRQSGSEQENA
jgi:pimeloyl-ACP methyl ester carboxylesterase